MGGNRSVFHLKFCIHRRIFIIDSAALLVICSLFFSNEDENDRQTRFSRSDGSSHAARSLSTKSEENIFKGMLPFLEFEGKKKSLSGSGGKNVTPVF